MSIWQTIVALMLEQLNPMYVYPVVEFFVYRLVELAAGKSASTETFLMRWLPTVLQTAGLRQDHAQLLSMNIYATWLLGCVVCLVRNATRRLGSQSARDVPANRASRSSDRNRQRPGGAAEVTLRAIPRRPHRGHRLEAPSSSPCRIRRRTRRLPAIRAELKERGHGLAVYRLGGPRP